MLTLYSRQIGLINFNNMINTAAFWPQYFTPGFNYIHWVVLGMLGLVMATSSNQRFTIFIVAILFFFSIQGQLNWHTDLYAYTGGPTSIVGYIEDNIESKSCIGLDSTKIDRRQSEILTKYKYYLYRYEPRRIGLDSWPDSDCKAIITFDSSRFQTSPNFSLYEDKGTGMFVISKTARR